MRSVEVPLDGSPFGEQALAYAVPIARRGRAVLRLVHVHMPVALLPLAGAAPGGAVQEADLRTREAEYLDALARGVEAEAGVRTETAILDGVVVDALDRDIRESGVELVVMTTHGRGGFDRAWLGSTADGLLRRSTRPILLVRPREEGDARITEPVVRRFLVPLDGSRLAEQALSPALRIADLMDAEVVLLRVVTPQILVDQASAGYGIYVDREDLEHREDNAAAYLERTAERVSAEGRRPVRWAVLEHPQPAEAILREAKEDHWVAMATHGRGGVLRLLLGSVADRVLRGARSPVLLVRPAEE